MKKKNLLFVIETKEKTVLLEIWHVQPKTGNIYSSSCGDRQHLMRF